MESGEKVESARGDCVRLDCGLTGLLVPLGAVVAAVVETGLDGSPPFSGDELLSSGDAVTVEPARSTAGVMGGVLPVTEGVSVLAEVNPHVSVSGTGGVGLSLPAASAVTVAAGASGVKGPSVGAVSSDEVLSEVTVTAASFVADSGSAVAVAVVVRSVTPSDEAEGLSDAAVSESPAAVREEEFCLFSESQLATFYGD